MNYIIFDLEWNQCPDGKSGELKELPFEIIEIGAIKLNHELQEIGRFHEYIRPRVYRRLHFRTQEIIHVSQQTLNEAAPFPEVIERFRQWCDTDVCYCIWGSLDFLELQRNMRYHHTENFFPFPLKYYDIQKIFSLTFEDGKNRRTLEYAIDFLGLPKDVAFHEAISDAYYTAEVIKHIPTEKLMSFYSFDYFRTPKKRKDEIYVEFGSYTKLISREFTSKKELLRDRKIASTRCYLCNQTAKKKLRWMPSGTRNYICLAYCEQHGYLKGKLRVRHTEDGSAYYCVKTLKLIDVDHAQELCDRVMTARERRRIRKHSEDSQAE
ncbi:MAG: 3'-5' exonuclease [Eubacteriales bacterium]|nr:3'-5' exonuclease [Eubacteriales bacterium]